MPAIVISIVSIVISIGQCLAMIRMRNSRRQRFTVILTQDDIPLPDDTGAAPSLSHSEQPVGSPPGAAGVAAQSAPASCHVSAHSPCCPARPLQGEAGAGPSIHGCSGTGPVSSGTSCVPDAAEAGEVSRPDLSSGGSALSPDTFTRVIDTENGCVRATRVDGGAWYLSMSDARHSVCAFLTAEEAALLFTPFPGFPA